MGSVAITESEVHGTHPYLIGVVNREGQGCDLRDLWARFQGFAVDRE